MPPQHLSVEGRKFLVEKSSDGDTGARTKSVVLHANAGATGPHPSTSRALVLRKAVYDAGELVVGRKISGQEKLSLLANDIMTSAVRPPFRMDELLKMAESQLGVHLDEISNLKDPTSFYEDIFSTLDSIVEPVVDKNGARRLPLDDTRWVAQAVGCRIHNVYLLAGSWRIVRNLLRELEAMGLHGSNAHTQLRNNMNMRTRYLILYDVITMLARMGQQRLANIAANTPHYAPYFVRRRNPGKDVEMEFDHHGKNSRKIREAHKSFIDAIILELVLPDSKYPPYVSMALLHSAVEECRKEEKRFSQALWDSIGDFSVTIQVLDSLEGPLQGPLGEDWLRNANISREFNEFLEVQALSIKASRSVESWRPYLKSLIDTRKEHTLLQLWYNINKSYQQVSGLDIDHLWSLHNDLERLPQWSTYVIPGLNTDDSDENRRAVVLHKGMKESKSRLSGKQLQIGDESDDLEMPGLITDSDFSEASLDGGPSDGDGNVSEGDMESDYNSDEDEILQEMLQEALDAVIDAELPKDLEFAPYSEDMKSINPFTRMLANLKDRYFSANPKLKANEKSRNPFKSRPGVPSPLHVPPEPAPKSADYARRDGKVEDKATYCEATSFRADSSQLEVSTREDELPPLSSAGALASRTSQKVTIKEVVDEDDAIRTKKKKKKKKKIKRPPESSDSLQHPSTVRTASLSFAPPQAPKGSPSRPSRQSERQPLTINSLETLNTKISRPLIPLPAETTAQSARAYMQSESPANEKTKVKTRPAFAGSFFKSTTKELKKPVDNESEGTGLLAQMGKIRLGKAASLMKRLLAPMGGKKNMKKPMKWEEFLKVMRAMGFSYDPSTAGSSVRFDPPNPKDPPITFHKPHPDPTLQRNHIRDFGKRLKKLYGWSPEQFSGTSDGEDDN